jgi:hypothetical protein
MDIDCLCHVFLFLSDKLFSKNNAKNNALPYSRSMFVCLVKAKYTQ